MHIPIATRFPRGLTFTKTLLFGILFNLTLTLPFTNFSTMLSTATFEGAQARIWTEKQSHQKLLKPALL